MPVPSDPTVIGIGRLQLSQGRFRNGALYISAIVEASQLEAIDCRFFVEASASVTPTRKGFRVRRGEVAALEKLLHTPPHRVTEQTLWSGAKRKLIARRCDDEYGKGIDFRYHKTSKEFEGWEQRGIRLKDEDFVRLGLLLRDSPLWRLQLPAAPDLFAGKTIASARGDTKRGAPSRNLARRSDDFAQTPVGEALRAFLNEE